MQSSLEVPARAAVILAIAAAGSNVPSVTNVSPVEVATGGASAMAEQFSAGSEPIVTVLFFFSVFMLLGLLFKLFVAQYAIEFSAFTKAAVAALILGKIIPLLDWAESGHRFETHRRAVVIAGKTLVYGVVVIVIGMGEGYTRLPAGWVVFAEASAWSSQTPMLTAFSASCSSSLLSSVRT